MGRTVINLNTFNKCDNVVVLGAGPSIVCNIKRLKKIIKDANPIVISSNYNYGIKSDYTIFTNRKMYIKNHKNAVGKTIVSNSILKCVKKSLEVYVIISDEKIRDVKKIGILDNGSINHTLCNSGFAALLVSYFFRPSSVFFCGFDGPDKTGVKHFNGKINVLKDAEIRVCQGVNFLTAISVLFRVNKIKMISFLEDKMWGINKTEYGIINWSNTDEI